MYLLDTNVISELRKLGDNKADPQVVRWFSSVSSDQLYLSVISLLELEKGIMRIERKDQAQGKLLRHWLEHQVIPIFSDRILPVDVAVVKVCAKLHTPDPKPESDALIAATALVHGMTVVSRNIKDFQTTTVSLINPWDS